MHIRSWILVPLFLLALLPAHTSAQTSVEPRCFPGVSGIEDCINPAFRPYWEQNGGLAVFGYPTSPALPEQTADGLYTVQHFERSRLELHPDSPVPIQLGRLGADRLTSLGRGATPAGASAPGCRFFAVTGHNVCGTLLTYWQTHGLDLGDPGVSERESLALLGLPLTEATPETNSSGDNVPTQWFERVRLEEHHIDSTVQVLQGRLDAELEAALTPASPPPGFITIQGNTIVQQGQTITLKGLNYYPAAHPWGAMWTEWDGPSVDADLFRAHHELGINVVRVLVPYSASNSWTDDQGHVRPQMLDRLRQFVQIAGRHQIKVIVTLFDWHDGGALAGSRDESFELSYLRTIVDAFKDDDRVFAWDLHNEPDNYPTWMAGQIAPFVDWLGRMADAVHSLDSHHPVTVGVGKADSLWQAAPNGRTIASLSDIISVHSYDAAQYAPVLADLRSRSTKPVLLEEFGWPTGPECRAPFYDEPTQLYLYRLALKAGEDNRVAGMLGWWFQDVPATLGFVADENGHFGLYRRDGQPKPAIAPFRGVRVAALPSLSNSDLPLEVVPPPQLPDKDKPLVFDDGMVIRESFKHFWNFFGGEAVFGRPITLAYRDEHGKLVQYFQRARFELNESVHVQPIDPDWPEGQTPEVYLDRVHLAPLGAQMLGNQQIPRVPDPGDPAVRYFPQTGHTLSGDFRSFWETHGEIFFGPPLTEAFDTTINSVPTRVQYFTYWRFEQQGNGPVHLSTLGEDALKVRQCPKPY